MSGMNKFFLLIFISVAKKIYADYKKVLILILIGFLIGIFFIFSSNRNKSNTSESEVNASLIHKTSKSKVNSNEDAFISKLTQVIVPSSDNEKPKFVKEFLGIKILSSKEFVLEKLGAPSSVQFKTFNIKDSRVDSSIKAVPKFFNGTFVTATDKELRSRPNGFFDFSKWDYEQSSSIFISIFFDDSGRVKSIECLKFDEAESDNKWESLRKICSVNGVNLSDGKSHVLYRLGKSSWVFSDYYGYENLNMYVNFTDDLLTSIVVGKRE